MNTKRTLGILVFAAVLVGIASPGHALRIEMGEGMWPESWPEELEPLRGQSNSIQAGIGIAEVIYDITFTSREQFESVWPAILNLKSPGAPLRRFGGYNQRPMVRIYAPPSTGAIDLGPDGRKQEQRLGEQMNGASPEEHQRLRHAMHDLITKACNDGKHLMPGPPWPESVLTEDGEVPAYVNAKEVDGTLRWVAARSREMLPLYRARIEIELYFDGEIIDLDRIVLPNEAPVAKDSASNSERTPSTEEPATKGEAQNRNCSSAP